MAKRIAISKQAGHLARGGTHKGDRNQPKADEFDCELAFQISWFSPPVYYEEKERERVQLGARLDGTACWLCWPGHRSLGSKVLLKGAKEMPEREIEKMHLLSQKILQHNCNTLYQSKNRNHVVQHAAGNNWVQDRVSQLLGVLVGLAFARTSHSLTPLKREGGPG
jgi:hypothetical protein